MYNITEHTMDNKTQKPNVNSEETCAIFGCDSPIYVTCPDCKNKVCASCVVKTLTYQGIGILFNCSFCRASLIYDKINNLMEGTDSPLKSLFATAGIREQDVPNAKVCECDAHTSYVTLIHVPCSKGNCFRCRESIINSECRDHNNLPIGFLSALLDISDDENEPRWEPW